MLPESRAIEAVQTSVGEPPLGRLVATRRSDHLWSVVALDEEQRPLAGGGWLVGDDGKVYGLSSNPGIHDWELAVRLLDRLYGDGLATHVEPEPFSQRLREVTEQRWQLEAEVLRDARAGTLRGPSTRVLP